MKKGTIISAIIGAVFFGISYINLKLNFVLSISIGITALIAGNLIFGKKEEVKLEEASDEDVIKKMKTLNNELYWMIAKVNSDSLKSNIQEIVDNTNKIIDKVTKDKNDLGKIRTFIDYYLPVTLKILKKYDEIENQSLDSKDSKEFMKTVEEKIAVISNAFKGQLAALYQQELIDVDAELGVLENMLKSEGYTDLEDFNIKGRGNNNG